MGKKVELGKEVEMGGKVELGKEVEVVGLVEMVMEGVVNLIVKLRFLVMVDLKNSLCQDLYGSYLYSDFVVDRGRIDLVLYTGGRSIVALAHCPYSARYTC